MKFSEGFWKRNILFLSISVCLILSIICLQEFIPSLKEKKTAKVKLLYRSLEQGEVILIKISNATEIRGIEGELFSSKLKFWQQKGAFWSLVGIGLSKKPGEYILKLKVDYRNGSTSNKRYRITIKKKQFGIQRLSVDPRFIHLTSKDLIRIRREQDLLRQVYNNSNREKLWLGSFIIPLKAEISSSFGLRRIFNNQPRGRHYGVDLDADFGTLVEASNSGRIVLARELFFAGNCIIIDHGKEIFSYYCHLSKFLVQEGESVEKGKIIGQVGATGRVTGPHLHWSVKVGGVNIDPYSILSLKLD